MDRAELLKRAAHYRDLAARMTDEQTRARLHDLAEQYEALVREAEKGAEDHSDDPAN